MTRLVRLLAIIAASSTLCVDSAAQETPNAGSTPGDRMLASYWRAQTAAVKERCLAEIETLDDWEAHRARYRRELHEMLGLDPLPERTDLEATVTGRVDRDEFTVERLHFQSLPGLYVTGNVYVPKGARGRLPTILYVCGHGRVKKDGVSYGSKAYYQHHGAWFARHGYVCLTIDTVQLGEIEGLHHGTYRENMWWWLNRGYTPAGVEAWNCIRALDYLETRPDVDATRLGVTGRSGGGAYSWWIAALDDRIRCAVPVAGITDLENHVVAGMPGRFATGCVDGHCDCMYFVNTYRWDYPLVAALVAPRPLLISNTDRDSIFPLDGVYRTYRSVERIYRLHGAEENLALHVTAGGHQDTQELRVHAFRWFDRHLKNEEALLRTPAEKLLTPEELKVFATLPKASRNADIHESFVAAAEPALPADEEQWKALTRDWRARLSRKSFAAWPQDASPPESDVVFSDTEQGVTLRAVDFDSQGAFRLRLFVAQRETLERPDLVVLNVLDGDGWTDFLTTYRTAFAERLGAAPASSGNQEDWDATRQMFASFPWAMAYVAPRGIGGTAWSGDAAHRIQIRRRFYLLGQSLDGMRVYDVRRAIQTLRQDETLSDIPLWLQSEGSMAGVTLYASLFEPDVTRLDLYELPPSHRAGPFFLDVRRTLDMPQAVAMAAERSSVILYGATPSDWEYVKNVAQRLQWSEKAFRLR